jgi:ribonuclease HI
LIEIYTDGSCNPKANIGGWAAILFLNDEKVELKGISENTTHNRMELLAVINAIEYVRENGMEKESVLVYTDSQYVEKIKDRASKIEQQQYRTKAGNAMRNADLVEILISQIERGDISFKKVKAHQKAGDIFNLNREVDKIARKLVREGKG